MNKFKQDDFQESVRNILKNYGLEYKKISEELMKNIFQKIKSGESVYDAVSGAITETAFFNVNKQAIVDAVYLSACAGYGILPNLVPNTSQELIKNKLLSDSWTGDKMPLSERLHTANKIMKRNIVDTITSSMLSAEAVKEMAINLYDGYNSKKGVINKAETSDQLKKIESLARLAAKGDSSALANLQKSIKNLNKNIDNIKTGELKAAYQNLIDNAKDFKFKAIERAIKTVIEEKTRYLAERIARTESARAWFDGYTAENQDNEDVFGYRWALSSRHKFVPYDQCDVCANMDVGFGPGIYPKGKVPSIPRHPHCMCMLEVVYKWEVNAESKFNPNGARKYLDSLDEKQKLALFGRDGAKAYDSGFDWQKLLKDWDGFNKPNSRLDSVNFDDPAGDAYKVYSEEQIEKMANEMYEVANKYTENESKWSGNLVLSEDGLNAKHWNCDIALETKNCKHLILHEQLHAHSISYYDKKTYLKCGIIEEASVQLYNQEISKKEKIKIIKSGYDEMVESLRLINKKAEISSNDFEFARQLFHVPLPDRLNWLYDRVYQKMMGKGNLEEFQELNNILDNFWEDF